MNVYYKQGHRIWKDKQIGEGAEEFFIVNGSLCGSIYDRGKGFISRKLPPSSTLFKR